MPVSTRFKAHVLDRAAELYAAADGRAITTVIAKETGRPEPLISWIIVSHAISQGRALETLRMTVGGALSASAETERDIESETFRTRRGAA